MGAQSASFRGEMLDTFCVQDKEKPPSRSVGGGVGYGLFTEVLRDRH
jgi:hypothetical protein